jgi:hypothetical protein
VILASAAAAALCPAPAGRQARRWRLRPVHRALRHRRRPLRRLHRATTCPGTQAMTCLRRRRTVCRRPRTRTGRTRCRRRAHWGRTRGPGGIRHVVAARCDAAGRPALQRRRLGADGARFRQIRQRPAVVHGVRPGPALKVGWLKRAAQPGTRPRTRVRGVFVSASGLAGALVLSFFFGGDGASGSAAPTTSSPMRSSRARSTTSRR